MAMALFASLLLVQQPYEVDIWRGAGGGGGETNGGAGKRKKATANGVGVGAGAGVGVGEHRGVEGPALLARIKTSATEAIACSAVSPDGRHVAFSDSYRSRLYDLTQAGEGLTIRKRKVKGSLPSAHALTFTQDSLCLILASREGPLLLLSVETGAVVHHLSPPCPQPATLLAASPDGQWVAVGDGCGRLSVYNLETMRHHWSVPLLDNGVPSAVTFRPGGADLVIATSANRIHIVDVDAKGLSQWSKVNADRLPRRLRELPGGITGLAMSPGGKSCSLVAYNSRCLCIIDLAASRPPSQNGTLPASHGEGGVVVVNGRGGKEGKRKREDRKSSETEAETNFKMVPMKSHALFVGFTGADSLLVVEKDWAQVLKGLPAPLYYHKYGT